MSLSHLWLRRGLLLGVPALVAMLALAACGGAGENTLTIYSGRSRTLVQPALDAFAEESGIEIRVRYGASAEIVATILEEGDNSPADVVFLQDPGSLGALSEERLLGLLPDALLQRVDRRFRSPKGEWVGTSGRARTVIYNTERIDPDRDLPDSIVGFSDPKWKGRIGWAPENGSFQAFVTALRVQLGEEQAREWLKGLEANDPRVYPKNTPIVAATAAGEIDVGFVNHYYLHRFLAEQGQGFEARNHYFVNGDPGALVLVAGVGILKTAKHLDAAERFIDYMLREEVQEYFSRETFEFPLLAGVGSPEGVPSLDTLDPPDIDLSDLEDLRGTLDLLRELGILS